DDHTGLQGLDLVDALDPALPVVRTGQTQHLVHAVVDDVACHDGVDDRNVQDGAVRNVRLPDLDGVQLVAVEGDRLPLERVGQLAVSHDLAGQPGVRSRHVGFDVLARELGNRSERDSAS